MELHTPISKRDMLRVGGLALAGAVLAAEATAATVDAKTGATSEKNSGGRKMAEVPEIPEPPMPEPAAIASVPETRTIETVVFERDAKAKESWDETVEEISKACQLTTDGTEAGRLSDYLLRIEHRFKFKAEQNDTDFSKLHIEPLLDQAADLLDRGLRDRAVWDDMASKALGLWLEINEYRELDAIHLEEERKGMYDIPAKESKGVQTAEQKRLDGDANALSLIRIVDNAYFQQAGLDKLEIEAQRAAYMSGLVPYWWDGQSFKEYVKHNIFGQNEIGAVHYQNAAAHQTLVGFEQGRFGWLVQKQEYSGSMQARQKNLAGLDARATWDKENSNFMRRRTKTARKYQDIKAKAATDPDGVLNLTKRMAPLRARFRQDFRDALARLRVVCQGMAEVYGYDVPLPKNEAAIDYFDQCLFWNRQAIQWLIRFSRMEQSFVLPISVRDLAGDAAWKAGMKAASWEFTIPVDAIPNAAHVRLRGLSAYVMGCHAEKHVWQALATPPTLAQLRHLRAKRPPMKQPKVPVCRFGRVTVREAIRDPDIVGVSALHNASPFGIWNFKLTGCVPHHRGLCKLEDVILDLHVAFRFDQQGESGKTIQRLE
jgi:hypothetical protein